MATKIITVHFTSAGVPALGLSPTINIYNAQTNVLLIPSGAATEIGDGFYKYVFATYNYTTNYVFIFDGGAGLTDYDRYKHGGNESYEEDISYEVWEEPGISHTVAGSTGMILQQIKADTNTIVLNDITFASLLNTMLKYERNRTKIDVTNAQLLVYDNDQITLIQAFDLKDINGAPSVVDVLERVPTM